MMKFESADVSVVESPDQVVIESQGKNLSIPRTAISNLIELLSEIAGAERSRAFRVPVNADAIQVTLRHEGRDLVVISQNISMIGIGVRLEKGHLVMQDDQMSVKICYCSEAVVLTGIARVVKQEFLGLEFPECLKDGEPEALDPLRKIVSNLQLIYLRELQN